MQLASNCVMERSPSAADLTSASSPTGALLLRLPWILVNFLTTKSSLRFGATSTSADANPESSPTISALRAPATFREYVCKIFDLGEALPENLAEGISKSLGAFVEGGTPSRRCLVFNNSLRTMTQDSWVWDDGRGRCTICGRHGFSVSRPCRSCPVNPISAARRRGLRFDGPGATGKCSEEVSALTVGCCLDAQVATETRGNREEVAFSMLSLGIRDSLFPRHFSYVLRRL